MIKLYNAVPAGDACGWGVCGSRLAESLPGHCEVVTDVRDAQVLLVPVDNRHWGYGVFDARVAYAVEKKIPIVGYGFHEFDIIGTQQIEWLPRNYSALACGSSWMTGWVKNALQGVADDLPVETVLQGVDSSRFKYLEQDKPDFMKDRFVVGSAGKFEYRKAQDVVIEVFRRFKKSVPEALLLLCWDSAWAETMASMSASKWKHNLELVAIGDQVYVGGVDRELIAPGDQATWRMGSNADMPNFYRNADAAIFPNRCEAGNNNCLVEAVASGVPSVILDGHGHEDVVDRVENSPCVFMEGGKNFRYKLGGEYVANWVEPCVDEGLSDLYRVYREQASKEERIRLSGMLGDLTWDKTASGLVDLCKKVVK